MKFHPPLPKGLPTGRPVALAVLVATQTGQGQEEVAHRPVQALLPLTPRAQPRHPLLGQHLCGRPRRHLLVAAGPAQVHQQHATTLNKPIIGFIACAVVNCGPSMSQPVFCALWNSSAVGQRSAYQSTRSQACERFFTATLVNSSHSTASTPCGGSGSHTRTAHTCNGPCRCSPRACPGSGAG